MLRKKSKLKSKSEKVEYGNRRIEILEFDNPFRPVSCDKHIAYDELEFQEMKEEVGEVPQTPSESVYNEE